MWGQENSANPAVLIEGVGHAYHTNRVLARIDLSLPQGGVLALLGASGCGKSTLLNLVAGLLNPTEGRISIGGRVVADAATGRFVPPEKRGLGMVFQDYGLWPHLTVGQNVAFPLQMRGVSGTERKRRVEAALDRVGLGGFGARRPSTLSGGQQQRVAIARAVVAEPRLVLFDEPLSNLDRELRDQLATEIASLIRGLGLTAIYVTHDQAEAFTLADRVAVMRSGRIDQLDAPETLVNAPGRPEVADFLHLGTLARAEGRNDVLWLEEAGVALPFGAVPRTPAAGRLLLPRTALSMAQSATPALRGTVEQSVFRGDHHLLTVRVGALALLVPTAQRAEPGEVVGVDVDVSRLRFFPDDLLKTSPQEIRL